MDISNGVFHYSMMMMINFIYYNFYIMLKIASSSSLLKSANFIEINNSIVFVKPWRKNN